MKPSGACSPSASRCFSSKLLAGKDIGRNACTYSQLSHSDTWTVLPPACSARSTKPWHSDGQTASHSHIQASLSPALRELSLSTSNSDPGPSHDGLLATMLTQEVGVQLRWLQGLFSLSSGFEASSTRGIGRLEPHGQGWFWSRGCSGMDPCT